MNNRQKAILTRFIIVIVLTAVAVVAMMNFKDWVNRAEAMRFMQQLGQRVLNERNKRGALPPESYVDKVRNDLPGHVRAGKLNYRARWIDFEATPDTILAYAEKTYHSLVLHDGFIVLRLDGQVEWMGKDQFLATLARQQTPLEKEMMRQGK